MHCLCESGMSCAVEQLCYVRETTVWGLWNLICGKTNISHITAHHDLYLPIRFNIISCSSRSTKLPPISSPPTPLRKKTLCIFHIYHSRLRMHVEQNFITLQFSCCVIDLFPCFPPCACAVILRKFSVLSDNLKIIVILDRKKPRFTKTVLQFTI